MNEDIDHYAALPDPLVEPAPSPEELRAHEMLESLRAGAGNALFESAIRNRRYDSVQWPRYDRNAPDYAFLADINGPSLFDLTPDSLDRLISVNSFTPATENGVIAFALRGCILQNGHEKIKKSSIRLRDARPNHRDFRCVLGFYYLQERKITAFTGSTVPCPKGVYNYSNNIGTMGCNMLPTGVHRYYVWRHSDITPALRLARSNKTNQDLEAGGRTVVLRTENDETYGTMDVWDRSTPYDNIHCSYYTSENSNLESHFSSWGCLTVRGRRDPSDQWEKFQGILEDIGYKKRVDLLLLTGKEAALAESASFDSELSALRQGSEGTTVRLLQEKLGFLGSQIDGDFGPATRTRLVEFQHEFNETETGSRTADGIYSRLFDEATGWGIFESQTPFSPESRFTETIVAPSSLEMASIAPEISDFSLRAMPPEERIEDAPDNIAISSLETVSPFDRSTPVSFRVEPSGEPQSEDTKYYVVDESTGDRFYVGYVNSYSRYRGIARYSSEIKYDRHAAYPAEGEWAHFIWPTVMAESNGNLITINSWDRAHFTWGYYQLAAHTANDNLILLMRELLQLPLQSRYFPDLTLINGKVHQIDNNGTLNLEWEKKVPVSTWTETQIPRFMSYLNPTDLSVENREIVTAAKFIDWARRDPSMLAATTQVSLRIMKRKLKYAAQRYGLIGERPEVGIWVSDILHHGRGTASWIRSALSNPGFDQKLDALYQIDTGSFQGRRNTVRQHVNELIQERRFENMRLGEGPFEFD